MPSSLLARPSAAVATQLWRLPVRCSTALVSAERKPLGYTSIHTETLSGAASDEAAESRLPPDEFHRTASRHVLRGILRECTYLPDQFAASWIRQHAISRFRTYEFRNKAHVGDAEYQKRLETVRRKSRQAMYQLQRANEGDRKMLLKVLSMAYGRTGKRRRELLQPLLPVQQQETDREASIDKPEDLNPSAPQPTIGAEEPGKQRPKGRADGPVKTQVKEYVNNLPATLRAIVQSQIAASPPAIARRNPRRLGVEIPELNSWSKQMPDVRVKNQLSVWYASLLSTVQPPLPDEEWYRLRGLATGVDRAQPLIPRRTQLTPPPSVLETVVTRGKLPDKFFRRHYAHKITPRFMQRLWAEVFSQCPLMTYDSAKDKWDVVWGHHFLHDSKTNEKSVSTTDDNPMKIQDTS